MEWNEQWTSAYAFYDNFNSLKNQLYMLYRDRKGENVKNPVTISLPLN